MYRTTGLTREQVEDVAADAASRHPKLAIKPRSRGGNPALISFQRVRLTICCLRLNTCRAALGDFFATSQSTVSRVVDTFTTAIARVLGHLVPTGDDLDPAEQLIVDGTLLPRLSWRILHTDYRRPLRTFAEALTTVLALEFHRTSAAPS